MSRNLLSTLIAIGATVLYTVAAQAVLVSAGNPLRVDFTFPPVPPFSLPAVLMDETVEFGPGPGPGALNIGEGYEIATFDIHGVLLLTSSYTNNDIRQHHRLRLHRRPAKPRPDDSHGVPDP